LKGERTGPREKKPQKKVARAEFVRMGTPIPIKEHGLGGERTLFSGGAPLKARSCGGRPGERFWGKRPKREGGLRSEYKDPITLESMKR